MKHAIKLLGFQDAKTKKTCKNEIENIKIALSSFGKSRNDNIRDVRREITMAIAAPSTSRNQMVSTMASSLNVSKRILFKYTKFRVRIDENDEASCWDLICREPYRGRMEEGIREKMIEFWDICSHVILY